MTPSFPKTRALLQSLFKSAETTGNIIPYEKQCKLSVSRAGTLCRAMNLTLEDIRDLTDAWWDAQLDPIFTQDLGAFSIFSIQLNLVVGALAMYLDDRPDLRPLIDKLLRCDVIGTFCLTEIDHGLDARNLETTAVLLPTGEFELHSPHWGASKFMPPNVPGGIPGIGLIFARLLVEGEDRGLRIFIVNIHDGLRTFPGITVRLVHGRPGCKPLRHAITTFNKVKLPSSSLLGTLTRPADEKKHLQFINSRVASGAIGFSGGFITALSVATFVTAKYSQRRMVAGTRSTGGPNGPAPRVPIISFKTQYRPILLAVAQVFILRALYRWTTRFFCDTSNSYDQRHAVAVILKLLVQRTAFDSVSILPERCGAQGLMAHNHISTFGIEFIGASIAEGDALVLSLRLMADVLKGRYALPAPRYPDTLLYQHERGTFAEVKSLIRDRGDKDGPEFFNRFILPRCEGLAMGVGYRMAYEAAVDAEVDPILTNLYLASAVRADGGWYVQNVGHYREEQFAEEDEALEAALPLLDRWIAELEVADYVRAPIVSDEAWARFFGGLQVAPSHENDERTDGASDELVVNELFVDRLRCQSTRKVTSRL